MADYRCVPERNKESKISILRLQGGKDGLCPIPCTKAVRVSETHTEFLIQHGRTDRVPRNTRFPSRYTRYQYCSSRGTKPNFNHVRLEGQEGSSPHLRRWRLKNLKRFDPDLDPFLCQETSFVPWQMIMH